ncbi:hypothetical protein L1987_49265 [Smallanthus sonchifolius]|uniref:Uncharacterized protein n=1 Tax=Smallanthus sonchifolius TaxID=185202 RepID=A0ACB9FU97_9ASTR|nr:hypothetical protein L1987_49265 [Smallanthus sonchifolius]
MNLSSYTTAAESHHHYPPQSKTVNYSSSNRLAQSIHLSYCYSSPPELSESEGNSVSQPAHAPSLFERVTSFKFCYNETAFPVETDQISNSPGDLDEGDGF